MRIGQFFLIIIAAFGAGLAGAWLLPNIQGKVADKPIAKESTYERVMRTQTIRCGYIAWAPLLIKDPNSGQLSGVFYDYTEALGKALNLKIEWAEELGWGEFPTALDSGRIDALCSGGWANSARARVIDFVRPIIYQPMYAYARIDDKRFDNKLSAINDPAVTILTVEGATGGLVAAQDFPKAKNMELPQMTALSDLFVSLAAGKGDVVITNPATAAEYDTHNPGKIGRIPAPAPLRVFTTAIAIAGGQERFKRMLDIATEEVLGSGNIEKIITLYDNKSDAFLRVAPPYLNTETIHP